MPKLDQLLAPTWEERKYASQAIFEKCCELGEVDFKNWVEQQINAMAQPLYFLRNILAFWGKYFEKELTIRMCEYADYKVKEWETSLRLAREFELANIPTEDYDFMISMGVIQVIKSLGFIANQIEPELIECIKHPELSFRHAVEVALEESKIISGEGFEAFWTNLCLLTDDHYSRRKMVAKFITPKTWLMLQESIETGKPFNEKWQEYPAQLALETLPYVNNDVSKIAYDYLTENFFEQRLVKTQASYIHTLTRLSEKFGFNEKIAEYCSHHLYEHKALDFQDMDRLYSAYTDYLSLYNIKKENVILQQVNTPWALSTLCDNLSIIEDVPFDLLSATIRKSLGNYDGFDGVPHDNAIALLCSNQDYAMNCRYLIYAWWYQQCQYYEVHNQFELEQLQDVVKLVDVLGHYAKPIINELYLALNHCLKDEVEGRVNLWRHPYKDILVKLGYTQSNFLTRIKLTPNESEIELSDEYEPCDITIKLIYAIKQAEDSIKENE